MAFVCRGQVLGRRSGEARKEQKKQGKDEPSKDTGPRGPEYPLEGPLSARKVWKLRPSLGPRALFLLSGKGVEGKKMATSRDTRQRGLQQRVAMGLRLRSAWYPCRPACIMSSAVAALLLFTPTSGFMPTKPHHTAPPMLRQASVQGLKSPVWSLGHLIRGYASRVEGRRFHPLNLKGTVSSRDASTAAANLIQAPAYKSEDLLIRHPKLISGSLPNGECRSRASSLPPHPPRTQVLPRNLTVHLFFCHLSSLTRCRVQILHLQQQEAPVPLLRKSRGERRERG